MEGADLSWARMEGVNLQRAQMEGVDLAWARMDECTSLKAAVLRGAALSDVDFAKVEFSAEQIRSMFGDESVILPSWMACPPHWSERFDYITQWRKWQDDPEGYTPPPPPQPTE